GGGVVGGEGVGGGVAGGLGDREGVGMAVVGSLVVAAILVDVAQPRQRGRDRALVAVLGVAGERLGDLGLGLDVAPHHVERAADVVERARDAAGVVGAAEQLEAALQVLERELEIAL